MVYQSILIHIDCSFIYWYPQALFTTEQACRSCFSFQQHAFCFQKVNLRRNKHVCWYLLFVFVWKHQIVATRKDIGNGGSILAWALVEKWLVAKTMFNICPMCEYTNYLLYTWYCTYIRYCVLHLSIAFAMGNKWYEWYY